MKDNNYSLIGRCVDTWVEMIMKLDRDEASRMLWRHQLKVIQSNKKIML